MFMALAPEVRRRYGRGSKITGYLSGNCFGVASFMLR